MNNDYGRHVHRTWVDTHSQSIRTDPEIYLPGEIAAEDDSSAEDDHDNNDAGNDKGGLADVTAGVKRKAEEEEEEEPTTRSGLIRKVAKTTAKGGPSTASRDIIDDRRPDLTLIDVPVGESILEHPYGRQACLFIEMKVAMSDKPNPQGTVSRLFHGFLYY